MPVLTLVLAILTAACNTGASASPAASSADTQSQAASESASPSATASAETETGTGSVSGLFDSSGVHDVALDFEQAAYDAMIETYRSNGEKEWIEATVTIDGQTYERAGIRLKGNSSLRGLVGGQGSSSLSEADPASLPWLVDLDQFVDGQRHGEVVEFVIRSNNSETSLNEAVALELLERAGLASQDAVAVRFVVNGDDAALRLVIENPDDVWMASRFDAAGALYKAESTGDYSYRGDDADAYDEVFDQEAGKDNADLAPLIEFLDFINNADDETFAAEIADRLDVDAFATYLAMQELLDNFDDIDGPGNNSYLYYDTATGQFTVVPWDYNLAFGSGPGGGFGAGGPGGAPGDPGDGDPPFGGGGFGGFGGRVGNALSERLLAISEYETLVADRLAELRAELFDSGVAATILADQVAVLEAGAGDLVDDRTIQSEAERIAEYF